MGFYFGLIQQSFIRTKQALCQLLGTGMVQLTPRLAEETDAQSRNSLSVQYSVPLGEFYKELMVLCKSLNLGPQVKVPNLFPTPPPVALPFHYFQKLTVMAVGKVLKEVKETLLLTS